MPLQLEPSAAAAGAATTSRRGLRHRLAPFVRPVMAAEIAGCEVLLTSYLFSFEADIPFWLHPVYWVRHIEMLVIVSAIVWAIIAWPRRADIAAVWTAEGATGGWKLPLAVNLVLFTLLTAATIAFTAHAAAAASPPWGLFGLFCIPLAATALSLVWLAAPARFWIRLLRESHAEMALAILAGILLLALGGVARMGWEPLAGITLALSHALLVLYESGVHVDFVTKALTVGDFQVIIDQSCSGYEGMTLVTAFLAIYLWTFRASLRFPHAFLLLPLGVVAIFFLNVLRITALVSLGAHVAPEVAAGGFHSQAGWMSFLAVSIGFMVLAPRLSFFTTTPPQSRPAADAGDLMLQAYIVPFMALMAGSILASASAPYDTWMYGVKIALAVTALAVLRQRYDALRERVSPLAIVTGLVIGIAWIATDPGAAPKLGSDLGVWIAAQPWWLAAMWLAVRAFGGIIVVPIVEELAFRGLLYHWIIARRFDEVPFAQLSWIALVVSSTLFGLMHSRPIAGALAGAIFALLMVRSGRLSDAVAAHVAANAAIIAWAIALGQWSLL